MLVCLLHNLDGASSNPITDRFLSSVNQMFKLTLCIYMFFHLISRKNNTIPKMSILEGEFSTFSCWDVSFLFLWNDNFSLSYSDQEVLALNICDWTTQYHMACNQLMRRLKQKLISYPFSDLTSRAKSSPTVVTLIFVTRHNDRLWQAMHYHSFTYIYLCILTTIEAYSALDILLMNNWLSHIHATKGWSQLCD